MQFCIADAGLSEEDIMKALLSRLVNLAFGCHHKRMSWPITRQHRTYQVCCDCGAELDYSWEMMSCSHNPAAPRPVLSKGPSLKGAGI
jgi:hypothetical protein